MKYYNRASSNTTNNDRWIVEHIFPNEYGKFFIEAGACNGIYASSCYVLENYLQWTGICIEPNDSYFQELVKNRPHSICENLCLSSSNESVTYLEGERSRVHPMLGGIKANLIKYKNDSQEIVNKGREVSKKAITLVELLKKHRAPQVIHYLAMDIEGSEFPVLEKFPFEEYRILAISIEGTKCNDLLVSKGYVIVKNPFNRDHLYEQYFLHESIAWQKNIKISPEYYVSLGNNFKCSKQVSQAIAAYQKAIEIEPNNFLIYFYLASYLEEQGDLVEAIAIYQQAIEINPQTPAWLYGNLGNAWQKQGRFNRAITAYQQAISTEANPPTWIYYNLGDIFQHQEKLDQAIAVYQKAIAIDPKPPAWLYGNLGIALQKQGRLDEAIAAYQKAIAIEPEPPAWIYDNLSDILNEKDKLDVAILEGNMI